MTDKDSLISQYSALRKIRLKMEKEAHVHKGKEDDLRSIITEMIEVGGPYESDYFKVALVQKGRFPSWKDEFVKALGSEAMEHVISTTPFREELEIIAIGLKK